jgi:biotin-(acetyl-CoA carboxylase) ligase
LNGLNVEKADMKMKWVNDVFVNDKKCAGVLSEAELIG